MLLGDDLVDPLGGPLHLAGLVGHDVVVVLLARQLDGGVALAELELVGGLGRAAAQALEQVLERRRDDEDEQRVGDLLLDDLGALDVDLEDHVAAGQERVADLAPRRAVPVARGPGRLEELAGGAQRRERGGVEEVVVDAVDLAGPHRPRRAGHDVVVVGVVRPAPQRVDDRVLPDARSAPR